MTVQGSHLAKALLYIYVHSFMAPRCVNDIPWQPPSCSLFNMESMAIAMLCLVPFVNGAFFACQKLC
eukprot:c29748_g1_i1 orf=65-265(+)